MALRRVTLADLAPSSNVTDIILRGGQAQADAVLRGGDAWANAIGGVTKTVTSGLEQFGAAKDEADVQKAVAAGRVAQTPTDLQSVIAKLPPELQARATKGINDARMTATAYQKNATELAEAKQRLADLQRKSQQDVANHWGGLAFNLQNHLNDPDGGISAAGLGVGFSGAAGVPGADKFEPLVKQASDALEAAKASGDPNQVAQVVAQWRGQIAPLLERGVAGMDPQTLSALKTATRVPTKTITTRNADGSEVQQIVKDEPGQSFTSEPKPATIGSFEDYVVKKYGRSATPAQIAEARKVYGQADDRLGLGGMGGLYGDIDPKAIAGAIMRGDQPPTITDLGKPAGAAVSSELAKSGYNLSRAVTDWKATQKHIATLNGSQQLRLNQAVNALPDLLDSVDSLASQWKGGRFPVLNKANLALAKGGAYGSDVASVANKLDAQIADVNADLAVVYMGGNSPTDHGLSLASKSLAGDWDEKVLHDMVKMAKGNVIIRRNSILNTGVAGATAGNPYAPAGVVPMPPGGAEMTATGPNGQKIVLRNGQWVPAQ